jgi:Na+/H+ antiporter NhaD/arsenite permease-like protein
MISIIVLALVFLLISVRRIGRFRLQIWQIMLAGAITVLITGQISPAEALKSINFDIILFLFCMFVIGESMVQSGLMARLSSSIFGHARSMNSLVVLIIFSMGLLSALLMNDTMAIIGTPLILLLASKNSISPRVLLLSLAFAITIGSTMSPIGNPQNLLIAMSDGISNPFVIFLRHLFLPTIINLFIAYGFLRLYYRQEFSTSIQPLKSEPLKDVHLAKLCRYSLIIILLLIMLKIILVSLSPDLDFSLTYIALAGVLPIIIFSRQRLQLVKNIDWTTLVFFAAMFVLMKSVWDSGFFQGLISNRELNLTDTGIVMIISVVLSQFISNVPMVALYLPFITRMGTSNTTLMALAAGSTIAGNLSILGAASNVIIIQNAENKSGSTVSFWEFLRIGAPLTIANVLVYWLFLNIF